MSDQSPQHVGALSARHRRETEVLLDAAHAGWGPTVRVAVLMLTRRLMAAVMVIGLVLARARGWI